MNKDEHRMVDLKQMDDGWHEALDETVKQETSTLSFFPMERTWPIQPPAFSPKVWLVPPRSQKMRLSLGAIKHGNANHFMNW